MLVPRGLAAIAVAATAVLGLSLLTTPTATAATTDVPPVLTGAATGARAAAAGAALAADPAAAAVTLHRADPAVVRADADRLGLDLGAGGDLVLRRDWSAPHADGGLTWAGRVGDTDDSVTLVRRADGLTGTVRAGAALYRIQPVPGVGHAVIRVNEDARPPDHPEEAVAALSAPARPLPAGPASAGPEEPNTTIRVMVAASKAAIAAHTGDFTSVAQLAVAETNQSYRSGDIAIDLELAGYVPTTYAESANVGSDLNALKGRSDGKLDELHAKRDELRADVVALITEKGNACGVAPGLDVSADAAFVVATRSCATGYYSFGHEIGHLQGASHDKAQGTNSKYPYGHGYLRDGEWRTIMAYDCPKKCKRVQHWSNPNKQYNGQALGVAGAADNARVLNQTAARIGAFRP